MAVVVIVAGVVVGIGGGDGGGVGIGVGVGVSGAVVVVIVVAVVLILILVLASLCWLICRCMVDSGIDIFEIEGLFAEILEIQEALAENDAQRWSIHLVPYWKISKDKTSK